MEKNCQECKRETEKEWIICGDCYRKDKMDLWEGDWELIRVRDKDIKKVWRT